MRDLDTVDRAQYQPRAVGCLEDPLYSGRHAHASPQTLAPKHQRQRRVTYMPTHPVRPIRCLSPTGSARECSTDGAREGRGKSPGSPGKYEHRTWSAPRLLIGGPLGLLLIIGPWRLGLRDGALLADAIAAAERAGLAVPSPPRRTKTHQARPKTTPTRPKTVPKMAPRPPPQAPRAAKCGYAANPFSSVSDRQGGSCLAALLF